MKNKTLRVLIILMLLLIATAVPVMAQTIVVQTTDPPEIPPAVLLVIPVLAGSLGIPLINWLKVQFRWTAPEDKVKNTWLSFGVSLVLAVFALAITNSMAPPISNPETVVLWVSTAFSVATLIYKSVRPPE